MKIRLEHNGVTFEYTRPPLPEDRFKVICRLAAAGIYAGMVVGVAALCDLPGVITVAVATAVVAALSIMSL